MADDKLVSRLLLIGIAVVILAILITQYMNNTKSASNTTTTQEHVTKPLLPPHKEFFSMPTTMEEARVPTVQAPQVAKNNVMPNEPSSNELYKAIDFSTERKLPADCAPRDRNTVADLLPKDAANSKWAQANPAGTGSVTDQNFLNAGYLAGINTVGQTLKNANQQLRSDPPIEKINVGPWSQSTIEYDVSRRFFEIGNC